MSNWSSVILVWSSIDGLGLNPQSRCAASHRERLDAIQAKLKKREWAYPGKWHYSPPCLDESSLGFTCEVVALAHWNHFDPSDIMPVLATFDWQYPEEVGVLWKTEDMIHYAAMYLEEME